MIKKEATEISRVKSENELMHMLKHESKTYDLILYDVYIPKLNNLSNMQSIKELYPGIPVVALVSNEEDNTNKLDSNFDAITQKTVSKNRFYEILSKIFYVD